MTSESAAAVVSPVAAAVAAMEQAVGPVAPSNGTGAPVGLKHEVLEAEKLSGGLGFMLKEAEGLERLAQFCEKHSGEVSGQQRWQVQWIRGTAARLAEEVRALVGSVQGEGTVAYVKSGKTETAKEKAKAAAQAKKAAKQIADAQALLSQLGAMVVMPTSGGPAASSSATASPTPAPAGEGQAPA